MLKAHVTTIRYLAISADLVLIIVALAIAWFYHGAFDAIEENRAVFGVMASMIPVWFFLLNYYRLYGSLRRRSRVDLALSVMMVHFVGGVVLFAAAWLFAPELIFESVVPIFLIVSFFLMTLEKVLVRSGLGFFRRRGFNTRNLLLVGCPKDVVKLSASLTEHSDWGLILVGVVMTDDDTEIRIPKALKILGSFEKIVDICKSHPIDEAVFCTSRNLTKILKESLADLQELGVCVRVVLDGTSHGYSQKELGYLCDRIPFLTISSNKLDTERILLKRIIDIVGSLVGLVITAAILPFVALAIKLESSGPIFFGQQRVGESGRIFTVWKFRSMQVDAEDQKVELLASNEMNGAIFKIANDPRITRIGTFLRRTSLDEFPQFWNVLNGDMSLVGTRPPTPDEVAQYENWQRRRISIKPGITGIWQVSGRNNLKNFDDIVRLDLSYIDNWTLWLDIKILFRTVRIVLFREGSY